MPFPSSPASASSAEEAFLCRTFSWPERQRNGTACVCTLVTVLVCFFFSFISAMQFGLNRTELHLSFRFVVCSLTAVYVGGGGGGNGGTKPPPPPIGKETR